MTVSLRTRRKQRTGPSSAMREESTLLGHFALRITVASFKESTRGFRILPSPNTRSSFNLPSLSDGFQSPRSNHKVGSPTSVTFHPASHPAVPFDQRSVFFGYSGSRALPNVMLQRACGDQFPKCEQILQSSFPKCPARVVNDIIPQKNGFVFTVLEAYNHHRALIIRPDDVWLAILVQFNYYVNGKAEQLRKSFVSHEGKLELVVEDLFGDRCTMDYEAMCRQMTSLIHKNVVDPSLRDWLMPNFSTTTITDTTVFAMVMMASLKAYFVYYLRGGCGIPSVTLDGTKSDWEMLLARIDKLKEYGPQMIAWHGLLRPILSRFVAAFDNPNSEDNLDFWSKVARGKPNTSGYVELTGWITAFTVFDLNGNWQAVKDEERHPGEPASETMVLDGIVYPAIPTGKISPGYAEVGVKLEDPQGKCDAHLVAGSVASQICGNRRDTIRPLPGWWIFTEKTTVPEPYYSLYGRR